MNRPVVSAAFVACALLVMNGCGSSSSSETRADGSAQSSGDAAACGDPSLAAVDPTALIDDMEAPDSATAMGAARGGGWWAGGDDPSKAAGASITPDGVVSAEKIPGGRCGSVYANHVTGQGFGTWAIMNVSFGWGSVDGGEGAQLPYDASFRTGITFWARVGDTSSADVSVKISDKYSNDAGGICDKSVASGSTSCYDHFGAPLTKLSTTWQQYKVPFRGLSQEGFGIPRDSLDTSSLYDVEFMLPRGTTFDLWVDDISFY